MQPFAPPQDVLCLNTRRTSSHFLNWQIPGSSEHVDACRRSRFAYIIFSSASFLVEDGDDDGDAVALFMALEDAVTGGGVLVVATIAGSGFTVLVAFGGVFIMPAEVSAAIVGRDAIGLAPPGLRTGADPAPTSEGDNPGDMPACLTNRDVAAPAVGSTDGEAMGIAVAEGSAFATPPAVAWIGSADGRADAIEVPPGAVKPDAGADTAAPSADDVEGGVDVCGIRAAAGSALTALCHVAVHDRRLTQ